MDLKTRIRELKDEANNYGAIPYNPGHVDDKYAGCWYDADEWRPRHGDYCDGFRTDAYAYGYEYIDCSEGMYCGMEEQLERLEEIAKLEAAALWSATLDNPILATGNSLFPSGLVKTPMFVAALYLLNPLTRAHISPSFDVITNRRIQENFTKTFVKLVGLDIFEV